MKIYTQHPVLAQRPTKPKPQAAQGDSLSSRDLVATSLSLVGGAVSLAGGVTRNPLLMAAGAGVFALGSGIEAHRLGSSQNLDGQFLLNVGVGGSMVLGGLGLMFLGSPSAPLTPVQQFLNQNPVFGSLVR